jgi:hypothetical protein
MRFLRVSQQKVTIPVNSINRLSLVTGDYVYSEVGTETLYIAWVNFKYQIKEETKSVLDLSLFISEGLSDLHHTKQNCGWSF